MLLREARGAAAARVRSGLRAPPAGRSGLCFPLAVRPPLQDWLRSEPVQDAGTRQDSGSLRPRHGWGAGDKDFKEIRVELTI